MNSNVKCQCETDYVGQTDFRLEARIVQLVPVNIRQAIFNYSMRFNQSVHDLDIGQYLLDNRSMWQNIGKVRSIFTHTRIGFC